jgi:tRNA A37 threonylcarbamoyladenosine modification protein TsaB
MNLFLNAILESWTLILFDDKREIVNEKEIKTLWNESEKLLWFLDEFLNENKLNYNDLENIIVVAGPWSFTWIRTISLLVNTISFVTKNDITALNFFDLYNDYPIIKASSKRDSFFKKAEDSEIEILKNEEILDYLKEGKIKKLFWENKNMISDDVQIFENIDYSAIIKNIEYKQDKRISPIYIKKPSIS